MFYRTAAALTWILVDSSTRYDSLPDPHVLKPKPELMLISLSPCPGVQRLLSLTTNPSPDTLKEPVKISIPRYVLRGQGKDEHYEFEVKVSQRSTR